MVQALTAAQRASSAPPSNGNGSSAVPQLNLVPDVASVLAQWPVQALRPIMVAAQTTLAVVTASVTAAVIVAQVRTR